MTQTPQTLGTSGVGGDPTLSSSEGGASVRDRATQVSGTAKDQAAGVAQEVKYQARDLVGEARGQVRQQVDTQKGRISDLLREVSEELEQMAERSDRDGIGSDLARQVASRARDARSYLDGGGDVVDEVRRFARRRPGTFLLGALAAGVFAGRATRAAAAARKPQTSGSDNGTSRSWPAHSGTLNSAGVEGEYDSHSQGGTPSTAPSSTFGATTGAAYGTAGAGAYGAATGASGFESTGVQSEYVATPDPAVSAPDARPMTDEEYAAGRVLPADREERS